MGKDRVKVAVVQFLQVVLQVVDELQVAGEVHQTRTPLVPALLDDLVVGRLGKHELSFVNGSHRFKTDLVAPSTHLLPARVDHLH